jgi:hypothetical protein
MKPGIYNLPEKDYFAVKAFSSSLGKQMLRSCAHGLAYLTRPEEKPTEAQAFGKLIHRAVLEPTRIKSIAIKPKGMSFATTEGKAWKAAHEGKEIVPASDVEDVQGIIKSIYMDEDAANILRTPNHKIEQSVFVTDPKTGLLLKARFDLYGGNFIADLKSTRTADPDTHGFPREIAFLRYHVQAAFYMDVAKLAGIPAETFVFIAFEKEPPYACVTFQLDDMSIQKGREEYRHALDLYAECMEAGKWPGYSRKRGPEIVSIPDWALKRRPYESAMEYTLEAQN